jgi:hypothetical protein
MRQLKLPFTINYRKKENGGQFMTIDANFKNNIITFKSTSLKTMYKDSINFIEEMSDMYKKDKQYNYSPSNK